ncbi:MAG TPA: hypothetical protein VEF04_20625, partial [Blastocatellia bacterium]|nr:hypothetical protein [Blastocatellia bacterium]
KKNKRPLSSSSSSSSSDVDDLAFLASPEWDDMKRKRHQDHELQILDKSKKQKLSPTSSSSSSDAKDEHLDYLSPAEERRRMDLMKKLTDATLESMQHPHRERKEGEPSEAEKAEYAALRRRHEFQNSGKCPLSFDEFVEFRSLLANPPSDENDIKSLERYKTQWMLYLEELKRRDLSASITHVCASEHIKIPRVRQDRKYPVNHELVNECKEVIRLANTSIDICPRELDVRPPANNRILSSNDVCFIVSKTTTLANDWHKAEPIVYDLYYGMPVFPYDYAEISLSVSHDLLINPGNAIMCPSAAILCSSQESFLLNQGWLPMSSKAKQWLQAADDREFVAQDLPRLEIAFPFKRPDIFPRLKLRRLPSDLVLFLGLSRDQVRRLFKCDENDSPIEWSMVGCRAVPFSWHINEAVRLGLDTIVCMTGSDDVEVKGVCSIKQMYDVFVRGGNWKLSVKRIQYVWLHHVETSGMFAYIPGIAPPRLYRILFCSVSL